ncbi:MAG: hypothetical protein K8F91_21715 [Candidatus Obscuribacterales bacterium]|nr:hypothetical protein [Candidatus Obscuribacterales bacterium]
MQQNNSNWSAPSESISLCDRRHLKHRVFCALSGIDPDGQKAAGMLTQLLAEVSMRARAQSLGIDKGTSSAEMDRIQSSNEHRRQCQLYTLPTDSTSAELHLARCRYWQVSPDLAVDTTTLNHELGRRKARISSHYLV